MGKLHRTNAGYLGVSMEETQDPFWSYNKLALPLSETQRGIQSVISSAGTPWSNLQNAFDGSISNYANGTGNNGTASTITFPSPITGVTKLEYYYGGTSTYGYNGTGIGSGPASSSPGWVTVYNSTAITLNNLYFVSSPGDGVVNLYAVKINDAFYSLGGVGNPSVGDLGPSNYLVTHNGTTWQTSVSKFYGGATRLTNASNQYLTIPNNADFNFASEDWTCELWAYPVNTTSRALLTRWGETGISTASWAILTNGVYLSSSGGSIQTNVSYTQLSANIWSHLAVVRQGNTATVYVNGSAVASASFSSALYNNSLGVIVGNYSSPNNISTYAFDGHIQDVRIYKGIAKYTSSFIPPARSLVQTARRYPAGMHVLS